MTKQDIDTRSKAGRIPISLDAYGWLVTPFTMMIHSAWVSCLPNLLRGFELDRVLYPSRIENDVTIYSFLPSHCTLTQW